MFGASAASFQQGCNVFRSLAGLGDKVVGLKLLLRIPANLAANKQQSAARQNAIGIPFGLGPIGRLDFGDHAASETVCR